jgi:hypothetical protein
MSGQIQGEDHDEKDDQNGSPFVGIDRACCGLRQEESR